MLRKGNGSISAAGGSGWGGGGGGRISLDCYSIQDVKVTVHGLYLIHISSKYKNFKLPNSIYLLGMILAYNIIFRISFKLQTFFSLTLNHLL